MTSSRLCAEAFGTICLVFAGTGAVVADEVTGLEEFNGTPVDIAVTTGYGDECPLVVAGRREDWQIPDPREMSPGEFRVVRDLSEKKVRELLASLDVPARR